MMDSKSNKPKIVVALDLPKLQKDLLQTKCDISTVPFNISREEILKEIKGKNGIILVPLITVDKEFLDVAGPNFKYLSTHSVGFDHIDLDECRRRNVLVGYTPDTLTYCVAEMALALLFATARRVVETTIAIREGKWMRGSNPPGWMFGVDIAESVVGIVGLGRIGQAVAKRLQGFETKQILYCSRSEVPAATALNAQKVEFNELLQKSDFVIICVRLTSETFHMFDEDAFRKMKKNAILVNISRGTVIKQDALVAALETGQIRGAGLDVMEVEPVPAGDPLLKLDNCVLTPHNASATTTCREKMAAFAVSNILTAIEGKQMPGHLVP